MIEITDYRFESGAMSIIQMGEELIGHPSTALGEIVKNSYDADALECKVYIHLDENPLKSFLVVFDNGIGMNNKTLFGEWLHTSISSKRLGKRKSKIFERNYLGSKGIGRLAAMALGRYLTVITKTSQEKDYNWIFTDRDHFREETLLSNVFFPGGKVNKVEEIFRNDFLNKKKETNTNETFLDIFNKVLGGDFLEGTLVLIEKIDDSFYTILNEDFEDMELPFEQTSIMMFLRTLITPLELIKDSQKELKEKGIIKTNYYKRQTGDTFNVYYGANLYDVNSSITLIPVKSLKLMDEYDYRMIGKVDSEGEVVGHYSCKRLEKDRSEESFSLDKTFVFSDEVRKRRRIKEVEEIPEEIANLDFGEFYFDIRVFDRDIDVLDKLTKVLNQLSRQDTRRLLDKLIGFRVAKNGFGVKPYGEEVKDWMELGQMRVQEPVQVLGPNQILGYVFLLSPENDGLSEKTNREGFYENKAFINLKKVLRAILIELGRKRARFRLKHNLGRTISSKLKRPDTDAYIKYLKNTIRDKNIIQKTEEFVKTINTSLDNMEHTLTFSQRLATMGSGLELVYHELAQPITVLGGSRDSIQLNTNKLENVSLKKNFLTNLKFLSSSIDTLGTLKKSLEPAIGISRKKTFKPIDTFRKVCFLYTSDLNKLDIQIKTDDELENYSISDYEYAIWIASLNIVNNAVYWLQFTDLKRQIKFSLERSNTLIIQNTGPLIPNDALDVIFEYGVTMKKTKNATGLGLAFTRNILGSHEWDIWAENRKSGPAFIIKKME